MNGFAVTLIWIVIILAYWTPTLVVLIRKAPSPGAVIVINAFLGWSVVGWVVALAMACRSKSVATRAVQ
jgi:hypothetical protein